MNFGIKQIRKFPGRSVYNVNIFGCSEYLDALRRLIRMRVPQPMVARRPWSATVSCQGSGRLIACCCQGSAALCLPKDFSSKLHACYNRTQKPKLNKMLKKLCKVASPITINTCFKSSPIWIQIRCFVFAILWNGVSTLEKQNRFYDKVISKKKKWLRWQKQKTEWCWWCLRCVHGDMRAWLERKRNQIFARKFSM